MTTDLNTGTDPSAAPVLDRALDLVRFLRANCDWDAAQTPDSLLPYLIEEAHEVADAVSDRDEKNLTGELGDLLLNVAFQVILAEERAAFAAEDVVKTLELKMRRRHPHLYGDGPRVPWEELKQRERMTSADPEGASDVHTSVLHGLPRNLDPLSLSHRIQDRVASVGFDWPDVSGPLAKVAEELAEVTEAVAAGNHDDVAEEIGDLLFAAVNLSRLAGVHPTEALRAANRKFMHRFNSVEKRAAERGLVMGNATLEELDAIWDEIKRENRS
jgi:MazG family protein